MRLALKSCTVRSWAAGDVASLVRHANNRKIWINLRDRFPYPYEKRDAQTFIKRMSTTQPETMFAIDVDGAAVGGIGFVVHEDVERVSAEVGYWLGEEFWGRGITTEALMALGQYAIARPWPHPVVCTAVCVQHRVVPSARESRIRARGAAAAERRERRPDHRSAAVRVYRAGREVRLARSG